MGNSWDEARQAPCEVLFECPKKALNFLAEPRIFRRPLDPCHGKAGKQGGEMNAIEFWTAIDNENFRQPPMPRDAVSNDHRARISAWGLVRKPQPQDFATIGVDHAGQPRSFSNWLVLCVPQ
ncbi:hypothetical protein GCM10027065_07960 [Rhodanobacter koreensis]